MRIAEQTLPAQSLPASPQQLHFPTGFGDSGQVSNTQLSLPAADMTITPGRRSPLDQALRELRQRRDPVGLKVDHWYTYLSAGVVINLRAGPSVVRSWSKDGRVAHSNVSWREGTYVILSMQTRWLLRKRISLVTTLALNEPRFSLNFSLAVRNVLQPSDPAYLACKRGDWPTLRRLLEDKRASIYDTTGFGHSLLHVCDFRTIQAL